MTYRRLHWDEKRFSIRSNLRRGYVYTVFFTKKTGKVRAITAGCRYWQSWEEAHAHYCGVPTFRQEFSDASIKRHLAHRSFETGCLDNDNTMVLYACRREAKAILHNLRDKVSTYRRRKGIR